MRIFQAIQDTTHASVPANRTWHRNLYEPLLEMGHTVVLFPTQKGHLARLRRDPAARVTFSNELWQTFHREHNRQPFDLFFAYFMDGMVESDVIDKIRQTGVPTCNFSCNNIHQFDLVDEISPHFDFNLHSEKNARQKFLAIGANPLWWPMASNPKYFKPINAPRTIQVSFVGSNYALRTRYIAHLLKNGIDVHVYGPGWRFGDLTRQRAIIKHYWFLFRTLLAFSPQTQNWASAKLAELDFRRSFAAQFPANVHLPISDEELIALYSRSHISLGFLEVYDQHDPSRPVMQHLHLRDFEAPMSGALYFTGYMEELAEMFEPDQEVIVYRNQHELLDKARYYLKHPRKAEEIRQAGYDRARRDHTYQRRFETLFQEVGLEGR